MGRDNKKLPDHVLGIVSRLELREEASGWVAKITDGQLDRKDYVALNEALEALGGKWNRKLGGHLFGRSPAQAIDDLLLAGEFQRPTAGDFFQTPPDLTERMIKWAVKPGDRVLEPSAGHGRIVAAALAHGAPRRIVCVEKSPERVAALGAKFPTVKVVESCFLAVDPVSESGLSRERVTLRVFFDSVVMNPPFSQGQECAHILHALRFLRPGGRLASVASAGVLFRETGPYKELRARLKSLDAEIESLPEDTFAAEGTRVRTVLIRAVAH